MGDIILRYQAANKKISMGEIKKIPLTEEALLGVDSSQCNSNRTNYLIILAC